MWLTAELRVADCGRVTTLGFEPLSRSDMANLLHRVRVLRDAVAALGEALEHGAAEWAREARSARTSTS